MMNIIPEPIVKILALLLLIFFAVPLSIFDIRWKVLPLRWTLSALVLAFLLGVLAPPPPEFLISGLLGFITVWIIRILTRGGIGLGDGIVSAFTGTLLGIQGWLLALAAASGLALLTALMLLVFKKINRNTKIPFAPFLFAGAIITSISLLMM